MVVWGRAGGGGGGGGGGGADPSPHKVAVRLSRVVLLSWGHRKCCFLVLETQTLESELRGVVPLAGALEFGK